MRAGLLSILKSLAVLVSAAAILIVAWPGLSLVGERMMSWIWPETTGLIYVESPEVYTRQRLVNDRYRQDRWLKDQLDAIDDEDSVFIESYRALETYLRIASGTATSGGGTTDLPDDDAAPPGPANLPIPFPVEFALRSASRDKIRQLVLENALDDRHDLSGNTVFGLKFDTAVITGSRTLLSPAVVVKMRDNAVEGLTVPIAELAHDFLVNFGPQLGVDYEASPATRRDLATVDTITSHYNSWRLDVQQRLNDHKSLAKSFEDGACEVRAADAVTHLQQTPLCAFGELATEANVALRRMFVNGADVRAALDYVMRLPEGRNTYHRQFLQDIVLDKAAAACQQPDPPGTVGAFLVDNPFKRDVYPLPPPWGQFFGLQIGYRETDPTSACGADVDIALREVVIDLLFSGERLTGDQVTGLVSDGWLPLTCELALCTEADRILFAKASGTNEEARYALTQELPGGELLEVLGRVVEDDADAQLCMTVATDPDAWPRLDYAGPKQFLGDGPAMIDCFAGVEDSFDFGRYLFLRRMSEVESYTYAAFPRGDVSGVVSETTDQTGLASAVGLSGARGLDIGLDRLMTRRSVAAQPSIINFASGPGATDNPYRLADDGGFDFAWAIVKEGRKKPMIASQLVLISVPAYLTEIELDLWKGFLDPDLVPTDRGSGGDGETGFNDLQLEARLRYLMKSVDPRTVSLRIPPDYSALDGILIGTNLVQGPRINGFGLEPCYDVVGEEEFRIAIPGERLWRSTVVTLDGKKALEIEVMPDMRGILATFRFSEAEAKAARRPENGSDATRDSDSPTERKLIVWTSEGNDSHDLQVAFSAAQQSCEVVAAPD